MSAMEKDAAAKSQPAPTRAPRPALRSAAQVSFVVPLADNDGRPFSRAAFQQFEQRLRALVTAFSCYGRGRGEWSSSTTGPVYRDHHRRYVVNVAVRQSMGIANTLRDVVARMFRQREVLVDVVPVRTSCVATLRRRIR